MARAEKEPPEAMPKRQVLKGIRPKTMKGFLIKPYWGISTVCDFIYAVCNTNRVNWEIWFSSSIPFSDRHNSSICRCFIILTVYNSVENAQAFDAVMKSTQKES